MMPQPCDITKAFFCIAGPQCQVEKSYTDGVPFKVLELPDSILLQAEAKLQLPNLLSCGTIMSKAASANLAALALADLDSILQQLQKD